MVCDMEDDLAPGMTLLDQSVSLVRFREGKNPFNCRADMPAVDQDCNFTQLRGVGLNEYMCAELV